VTARVGDPVDVLLERREDDEGIIILSKEKAAKIKIWDEIREIYEKGERSGARSSPVSRAACPWISVFPPSCLDLKST